MARTRDIPGLLQLLLSFRLSILVLTTDPAEDTTPPAHHGTR